MQFQGRAEGTLLGQFGVLFCLRDHTGGTTSHSQLRIGDHTASTMSHCQLRSLPWQCSGDQIVPRLLSGLLHVTFVLGPFCYFPVGLITGHSLSWSQFWNLWLCLQVPHLQNLQELEGLGEKVTCSGSHSSCA